MYSLIIYSMNNILTVDCIIIAFVLYTAAAPATRRQTDGGGGRGDVRGDGVRPADIAAGDRPV